MNRRTILAIAAFATSIAMTATAANRSWINGTGYGNWATNSNWTPSSVPTAADSPLIGINPHANPAEVLLTQSDGRASYMSWATKRGILDAWT